MKKRTPNEDKAFHDVLGKLNKKMPGLYYGRTDRVAKVMYDFIHNSSEVSDENAGILGDLSVEDIRYKLSFTS
tara:strand:- start:26441 stop:26659 length:219 start_codon:yes stop_codon:yes gene_type:complete